MSRSNNRIPKQFLIDTHACEVAHDVWRKDIGAIEIVDKYLESKRGIGGPLYSLLWWIKDMHTKQVGNRDAELYWIGLMRKAERNEFTSELRRHCIRGVKTLLKEWRNAKLTTA